jgi:hypothetical protein
MQLISNPFQRLDHAREKNHNCIDREHLPEQQKVCNNMQPISNPFQRLGHARDKNHSTSPQRFNHSIELIK